MKLFLRAFFLLTAPARNAIRFLILFLMVGACIEPFNIVLNGNQKVLVVDGLITDQPGPYTVKLTKSISIDDQLDEENWVQGASISIFDDQANTEVLKETSPGNYQTATTQGVVGRSYFIQIKTLDGGSYQSAPEKLLPVGDISNLRYEFVQNETGLVNDPLNSKNGFNIYLDASVLPEQNGLVRWRWTGTFEILTYPKLKTKAVSSRTGATVILPDPPPCSGYYAFGSFLELEGNCTCCNCWITQYNDAPLLSDQHFVTNNEIKNFNVAFVQANRRYLFDKYYLEVQQMSVTQTVYNFWKKVQAQEQTGSDLFQTPPAPTTGNVTATSEGATPASGVFVAAAVKNQIIIISRDDLPVGYFLPAIDTIPASCTTIYKNSTTVKPDFW